MTPRSLMIIILRIAGILFLSQLLTAVPSALTLLISLFTYGDGTVLSLFSVVSVLTVLTYIGIVYMLVFKSEYIVDKLGMARGFEEKELRLQVDATSLTRIAIITCGAIVLLFAIPDMCQEILQITMQGDYITSSGQDRNWTPTIIVAIRLVLGLLIIGERERILQLVLRSPGQQAAKSEMLIDNEEPEQEKS